MKPSDLPRSRVLAVGEKLRQVLADAANEAILDAARRGGTSPKATLLDTLMSSVKTAIASYRDTTAPTVSARTQPSGVNLITITYAEDLDPSWVPPTSAFATSPVRTITGVTVENRTVKVAYSGAALVNSNTIAYTQSATQGHRDLGGTLAATFGAAAITVA